MFIIYLLEVKKSHKRRKTERRAKILEKPVATGDKPCFIWTFTLA